MNAAVKDPLNLPAFSYASLAWNNDFFLSTLADEEEQEQGIPKDIELLLAKNFGSVEKFMHAFKQTAKLSFGSGFVWLIKQDKKTFKIATTHDAGSPLFPMTNDARVMRKASYVPFLCLSLWEHAYIPTYGAQRDAYIDDFFKHVDWKQVAVRIGKATN